MAGQRPRARVVAFTGAASAARPADVSRSAPTSASPRRWRTAADAAASGVGRIERRANSAIVGCPQPQFRIHQAALGTAMQCQSGHCRDGRQRSERPGGGDLPLYRHFANRQLDSRVILQFGVQSQLLTTFAPDALARCGRSRARVRFTSADPRNARPAVASRRR
jgi:hypothetical protein